MILFILVFPLIKLAKKLKVLFVKEKNDEGRFTFPLIKLAKKLKDHHEMMVEAALEVSIN